MLKISRIPPDEVQRFPAESITPYRAKHLIALLDPGFTFTA
jgi:hypothetical protein